MYRKMLVANDGSPGGAKALEGALELAKRLDIGLTMVCVEDLPRFPAVVDVVAQAQADRSSAFDAVVESAKTLAQAKAVAFEAQIVAGHPVPRIIEIVEHGGYDLLVVGYLGHSALYEHLIGSTADRLVALAPCTVVVVK
ncbi:MAG: universal stress protein [Roseiarcus sp.]|jgi:nucleotide-binding universal stress UspA family protein